MRSAVLALAASVVLSQSCNQPKSAASEFLANRDKKSADGTPTVDPQTGGGGGGGAAAATSKTMYFLQDAICQQYEFAEATEVDSSMKTGSCPATIDVEGTATPKAKSCPTLEDAGNKVTFIMYGPVSDAAALDQVCTEMNKSFLEAAAGAELK